MPVLIILKEKTWYYYFKSLYLHDNSCNNEKHVLQKVNVEVIQFTNDQFQDFV